MSRNISAGMDQVSQALPFSPSGKVFVVGNSSVINSDDVIQKFGRISAHYVTLDAAISACIASRGDLILVAPGHNENVIAAAGIDADIAGIRILGLGEGYLRPTFTFTTAVTADIDIDAANITWENCIFDITSLDAITMAIDVNAADFTMKNCEIIVADSGAQATGVLTTGSARTKLINCIFRGSSNAGCNQAVEITGTPDGVELINCVAYGDFANAAVYGTGAFTNARIVGGSYKNVQAGDHAIELTGAATGYIENVLLVTDAQATAIDAGSLAVGKNVKWQSTTGGDVGVVDVFVQPDSTANILGSDDADNLFASTNVADNRDGSVLERLESIIATQRDDVASNFIGVDDADNVAATTNVLPNEDGSILERLEQVQESVNRGTGTSLAANESLADVLYAANGIATFPASALPANGISIAEVLREVYDQSDKAVTNATAALVSGTTIFTIAGGPIEIISLIARCVTNNDGTASTLQWSCDGTDGAATTFSAASASLASSLAGASVVLQGNTLATAPLVNASGAGLSQTVTNGVVIPAGIITTTVGVGSTTGTWQHHLRYRPLARGVTVS